MVRCVFASKGLRSKLRLNFWKWLLRGCNFFLYCLNWNWWAFRDPQTQNVTQTRMFYKKNIHILNVYFVHFELSSTNGVSWSWLSCFSSRRSAEFVLENDTSFFFCFIFFFLQKTAPLEMFLQYVIGVGLKRDVSKHSYCFLTTIVFVLFLVIYPHFMYICNC